MATNFDNNALASSGGFKPSTKDTPIDIRSRVATETDILEIPNPYVGMIVYVLDTGKRFEVLSIKDVQSGLSKVSRVDTYKEFMEGGNGAEIIVSDGVPEEECKVWIKAVEDNNVYPNIILDSKIDYINERATVSVGVKLDNEPLNIIEQVSIKSINNKLTINKPTLTFTKGNYNIYQYVILEHQIDSNIEDDFDTIVFSTSNEKYVELNITLIDEGIIDNNIYTAYSSNKVGYGFESIEGSVKNIQVFGRTTEGIGKLNNEGMYSITICSSNGGNLAVGEKNTANYPSTTEVGKQVNFTGVGHDCCTTKIMRDQLPPIIQLGSKTNIGNRIWFVDKNDILINFISHWGVQGNKEVEVPEETAYVIFGIQQKSEWNPDSYFACWNMINDTDKYASIDSVIDKIEFKLPHPLRSNEDESVFDEIRYNTLLKNWELITRIDNDGTILSEEQTNTLTGITKNKLNAYDGMTRMYMMECGTHPLITCDIPTSIDAMAVPYSMDETPTTYSVRNNTEYDNGIYVNTENGFTPLYFGASHIKLNDIYNYFASNTVEGAMNELYNKINDYDLSQFSFNDIKGTVPISKLPMEDIQNSIGSDIEVTMVSKLKGKNIICDGDSITYGSFVEFTNGVYPTIIKNKTGANVENISVPGSQFSGAVDHLSNAVTASPDVITFLFGANDAPANVKGGGMNDLEGDSIFNRVKTIIEYCNLTYPDAKIVIMTTLPRKGYITVMENYRTAIIDACRIYGAYCLDLHGQSGISLYTSELETKWTNGDGCHFLQIAHDRMASIIISFLESIM